MVRPAAPVWIGFRGHQSQAIRSKWSLCNTRQTAKSFRTKPRPPSCVCCCVCVCVCVCVCDCHLPLFHSTLAPITGLILVYFWASDPSRWSLYPYDCKPHQKVTSLLFFNQIKWLLGELARQPKHISNPFIPLVRFNTLSSCSRYRPRFIRRLIQHCVIVLLTLWARTPRIITACGRRLEGEVTDSASRSGTSRRRGLARGGRHTSERH